MKKFLLAAPLALAAGALLTTPASAASWNSNAGQIRAEIQQLDRQIDRARGLSNREEQQLHRQVDRLQDLYRSYARGGFSRSELSTLDRQVGAVKAQLYGQSRDGNRYAQRNDHRYDQRDNDQRDNDWGRDRR